MFHFKFEFTPLDVRVHLPHQSTDAELKTMLGKIVSSLTQLKEISMATAAEFTAGFARIDAATTAIATLIRDLIAKQQAGGMTAEEEADVFTQFEAVATSLEAMAATPTNPVPIPVPAP